MGNYFATPQTHGGDRHAPPPAAEHQQQQEDAPPMQQLESFTCEICIEPTGSSAQTFRPKSANCAAHRFCNDCMIKYIGAKLDDNIPKIPCPAPTCYEFLDPLEYRVLVGPPLFVRWCDALCEASLVGMEQCYCPNRSCSALVVNECGGAAVKKAACPSCKRAFCFQCKLPWHAGFRCEESGELRDRNDRAFGILAEQRKWRRCPQCHHFVELIEGCQIIKCRCHATFCFKCGRLLDRRWCDCDGSFTAFCGFIIIILLIMFIIVIGTPLLIKCNASFCYKCGRLRDRHWCNCDGNSTAFYRLWILRFCLILIMAVTMIWAALTIEDVVHKFRGRS